MIRVIVDWDVYYEAKGGNYRYFCEIIKRISATPGFEVVCFSTGHSKVPIPGQSSLTQTRITPTAHWFPNGRVKETLSYIRKKVDSLYWKYKMSNKIQESIFHSPYYTISPVKNIPQLPTILDMITEKFPEQTHGEGFDAIRSHKAECIKQATRMIAISNQTKLDLCELFNISPERVDVIHLGVDAEYYKIKTPEQKIMEFKKRNQLTEPFILHVGGRLHHKNFLRLLEAYATNPMKKDYLLVTTGYPMDREEEVLTKKLNAGDRVRVVIEPTDEEIRLLYQLAEVFVFPSYYEGFGLPLLEAMASGVPVAAANGGPTPEIVGNAAIIFDPFEVQAISLAIEKLLSKETAAKYRELGYQRVKQFTWDTTAEKTMESYRKTIREWNQGKG